MRRTQRVERNDAEGKGVNSRWLEVGRARMVDRCRHVATHARLGQAIIILTCLCQAVPWLQFTVRETLSRLKTRRYTIA